MKKWIPILTGLLIVQLVLALSLNLAGEDYGAFEPQEKLLAFDEKAVDELRIEDGEMSVVLHKRDDQWLLPESGDFPADQSAVDQLLVTLSRLPKGWPVATTAGAAQRFEVDEENFQRKLTLLDQDQVQAVLYVGTSPGFRKVHVRPAGEEAVYAVDFNTWQATAQADDWIDKDILKLNAAEVQRVEMPDFVLQREGERLQVVDQAEQTDAQEVRSLVGKLAGLRIQSLLGSEAKSEYQEEEPELEFKVTLKDGEILTYRFFKPEEGFYYVLKRSDLDPYFKVAEFMVKPIQEVQRENLVKAKANNGGPGETTAEEPDESEQEPEQ